MIKITNVLVATDFGEASTTALAYGRELARTFGARLLVLHVVENPMLWVGPETAGIVAKMTTYDPDITWSRITMTNE